MLGAKSNFWINIMAKYPNKDSGDAGSDWRVWHTNVSPQIPHDTGVIPTTTSYENKEELKRTILENMGILRDSILQDIEEYKEMYWADDENGTDSYWRHLHEFLALRHYYQIYLLDDRVDIPRAPVNPDSDPE